MTTKPSLIRRVVAAGLLVLMPFGASPVLATPMPAQLSGSILDADADSPAQGVVVHASDPRTGAFFSSEPTDAGGRFEIPDLPPSSYAVAVQANGGLYLVDGSVRLEAGQERFVQLAVKDDPGVHANAAAGGTMAKSSSAWNNPLIATLSILGAAVFVGAVINNVIDDDDSASPSSP